MAVINLVDNFWTRSRFDKQASIPYLRSGRTNARGKGWHPISKDLWMSTLAGRSIALLYSQHKCTEGENILSVWTPRSLTNLDTGVGMPDPSGEHDNLRRASRPILRWLPRLRMGLIGRSYFFDQSNAVEYKMSNMNDCIHKFSSRCLRLVCKWQWKNFIDF